MTPAERKRYDAKMAARHKAQDIADKKKTDLAKQNRAKERKQEIEGKAYGRSRGKVQEALYKEQEKGMTRKELSEHRAKLLERPSYGKMKSGTYRTFGEVTKGVDVTPKTTYSKGSEPVKKVNPAKKTVIKKGGKKTYKGKIPTTIKKKK